VASAPAPIEVIVNSRDVIHAEQIKSRVVEGRTFLLYRVHRRYFATRPGRVEFPTSHLEFGRVEQGFLGPAERRTYYKSFPAFAIDVARLPEEGRPVDFTGAVGTIAARATADHRDVTAGDSIKVSVEWSGEGNLEFFDP